MLNSILTIVMTIAFALGMGSLFYGWVFGLVAIPTLTNSSRMKYLLLIGGILIPPMGLIICLVNYQKTRYASRFIIAGLFLLAIAGVTLRIAYQMGA